MSPLLRYRPRTPRSHLTSHNRLSGSRTSGRQPGPLTALAPLFLLAVLFLLAGSPRVAGAQVQDSLSLSSSSFPSWQRAHYLWPTDASRKLSSTFGETRAAHFHAALDIKTWGQRGYDVYATRSGTLHRIAIGPRGYGKVVYLKHDDGSFSLYAHLLAFDEPIQSLADSLRISDNYAFEIDRTVDSLQIRIEQGERIGISGASGIGPPHLHFELRSPADRPFNPLLTNLEVEDTIAPAFSGLAVEPLSINSTVEGEYRIFTRRAWHGEGGYQLGTVRAGGEIGLAVDVYDQSNGVYNAYAVYRLRMWVDGKLLFHSQVDSFSYDETGQMFIDRVYPLLRSTGRGFQRLWIADGNTLPFYHNRGEHSGRLRLEPGRHEVRIQATDYFGNSSSARLTLEITGDRLSSPAEPKPAPPGTRQPLQYIDPANWEWEADRVAVPASDWQGLTTGDNLSGFVAAGDGRVLVDLRGKKPLYMGRGPGNNVTLHRIAPATPALVSSGKLYLSTETATGPERAFARFPGDTFYDTLSVGLQVRPASTGWDSLRVDVLPAGVPIAGEYTIHLPVRPSPGSRVALYRYEREKERLHYLPVRRDGPYLVAHAEHLGTFYLLEDHTPPELHSPALVRRPDGHWIVTVEAADSLSGIDHTRSLFEINGVRGIAEFEPEDDRLVYYLPGFQPREEMELRVRILDRAGNASEREFRLGMPAR